MIRRMMMAEISDYRKSSILQTVVQGKNYACSIPEGKGADKSKKDKIYLINIMEGRDLFVARLGVATDWRLTYTPIELSAEELLFLIAHYQQLCPEGTVKWLKDDLGL